MTEPIHPAAPHHLPGVIVAPGESDILFTVVVCLLIGIVLLVGAFYFKLHALPEKMAHSANSTQLQLIGILALLALFTHNNIFWVVALILAALRVPDFTTPLNAIARSLGELSSRFQRTEVVRLENPPLTAGSAAATPAAAPEISETAQTPAGVANAYTSFHDRLDDEDVGTSPWLFYHAVDAVGVVHAAILRIQALLLPVQTLVFSGH